MTITLFWREGFHQLVGVAIIHLYYFTIQNNDAILISGLTLTAMLLCEGKEMANTNRGFTEISRIDSGESRQISAVGSVTNVASFDAVCDQAQDW